MDYKEKYEMALERARQVHTTNVDENKKSTEYIFPELKESEDEKIKEEILELAKTVVLRGGTLCGKKGKRYDCKAWVAWLEKQGKKEQDTRYKYLEELLEADTIYQMAMNDAMVEEAKAKALEAISNMEIFELLGFEKQDEQKPQGKSALEAIKGEKVDNANKIEPKDYSSIDPYFGKPINNVEPKFHEDKKLTDDCNFQYIIDMIERYSKYCWDDKFSNDILNWFKSLKNRIK